MDDFGANIDLRPRNSSLLSTQGFVEFEPKDYCYIDEETARALELLHNNVDISNRKHSLLGLLNINTCTTSGTRLIKDSILKPFYRLSAIESRLDCVEFLVNRVDTLSNISNSLKRFGQGIDLEKFIGNLVDLFKTRQDTLHTAERRLEAITTVESLLSQVPILISSLEGLDQQTLNIFKIALSDPAYQNILQDIYTIIEQDAKASRTRRGKIYRIRQGVESLFDIARSTYLAAIDDLEQYVRELNKEDGLPWKLSHAETRGYYLTLFSDQVPKGIRLDAKYIQVNKTRAVITCTTREMMQSNVRTNVSYENSMKLANDILTSTLSFIISNLESILKLVDIVAILDLLTSFAKLVVSSNGSLVRPKFTASDTMIVKGRHPLLESVLCVNNLPVIPNDVLLSNNHKNFMLITGPNMGGKSIFLRQAALIQIMAQIGCYVPAQSAHLKPMNRIVARTGTSDDILSSCSSFMYEMRGISSALQKNMVHPTENVLYVIDEVGRGTSIDDGAGYSFAIAEELASKKSCFTVFATHFEQVFLLTNLYSNITAYYFKYEEEYDRETGKPKLKITHCLAPGLSKRNHYGLRLAEACGLPDEILQTARQGIKIEECR